MKKRTVQKLLSMVLATVMTASLLTACGNNEEPVQSSGTEAAQGTESEQAPEEFVHDPVLNELGADTICNEKVTITIGIQSNAYVQDYETNHYTQMLEEVGNVDIEFMVLPAGNEGQEKLQMMIAGGQELPDIIMWGQSDALAMQWGEEEYLVPLEDYFENSAYYSVEKYAQIKEEIGLDILQEMTSGDGHIWGFPSYQETITNATYARMWVYQPWLEACGIEKAPTTTQEFYDMLVAFKTMDPNGNGKADEIPLLGCDISSNDYGSAAWEYLMNAFTHVTAKRAFFVSTDGQLSVSYTTDGWKEGVKYINSLVKEGLYDAVSFTQTTDVFQTVLSKSGDQMVGAFCNLTCNLMPKDHESYGKWLLLQPLEGPDGYKSIAYNTVTPSSNAHITTYCEHPEVAFRLLDLMCREDFTISSRWGQQGVHWDYVENLNEEEMEAKLSEATGVEVELDWENAKFAGYPAYFYEMESVWGVEQNYHWYNRAVKLRTGEITGGYYASNQRFDEAFLSDPVNTYILADYLNDVADLIPKEVISNITYPDADSAAEASQLKGALKDYVYEKLTAWFTGTADVDKDWDTYLKTLEEIGLSRYLELSQINWKK